jgi:hypothetical protein
MDEHHQECNEAQSVKFWPIETSCGIVLLWLQWTESTTYWVKADFSIPSWLWPGAHCRCASKELFENEAFMTARKSAIQDGPPTFLAPLHVGKPVLHDRKAFWGRVEAMLDRAWLTNKGLMVFKGPACEGSFAGTGSAEKSARDRAVYADQENHQQYQLVTSPFAMSPRDKKLHRITFR